MARNEGGAEFLADRSTTVGKHVRAFDRYERNGGFEIDRTYGRDPTGRSTWTIHPIDGSHSTLTIDATVNMPAWKNVVMRPVLKRLFYGINFTPFTKEAERRSKKTTRDGPCGSVVGHGMIA